MSILAAVGCQGPDARRQAFTKDLVQLETDAALGRYGEAIAQSSKLLAVATGACEICPVKVALARSQAVLGLNDQALETYHQIAKECADSPLDSSVAMLHLARWVAENDSLNAIPVFKELVRTFPDEPAARQAVTWIKDLMLPNNGQAQTANELMQFANEIRPDGQAKANVLYTAAELLVATDSDSQLALIIRPNNHRFSCPRPIQRCHDGQGTPIDKPRPPSRSRQSPRSPPRSPSMVIFNRFLRSRPIQKGLRNATRSSRQSRRKPQRNRAPPKRTPPPIFAVVACVRRQLCCSWP